jgi:hypothetical protein
MFISEQGPACANMMLATRIIYVKALHTMQHIGTAVKDMYEFVDVLT